ncbi:MAG TPA: two-component regulator propeller domain-containing protein [Rhodothermales bacterium]|nr:two-component regulator propeller domain-containing protein [Rhodothermales bacterium]
MKHAPSLLLLALAVVPLARGQASRTTPAPLPQYRFQRLTVAEGLPSNNIARMIQDRRGFLWVATGNGLVRYDGREVQTFRPRSSSGRVALRYVSTLVEDARGDLWAGGSDAGLWHLDLRTGRFSSFAHDPRVPTTLSGNYVVRVEPAGPDRLLVLTMMTGARSGICIDRMDTRTGQVRRFRSRGGSANAPDGQCANSITDVKKDRSGDVWVGTASGVYRYVAQVDSLVHFPPSGLHPYGQDRYRALDAFLAQVSPLAAVVQPGNNQDRTVPFRLTRPSPVLIVSTGDMDDANQFDYSWIEDARGRKVWEARFDTSVWMPPNEWTRLFVASRTLPAGTYRLRYRSDNVESPEKWSNKPERDDLWGVRVLPIGPQMAASARSLVTGPLQAPRPNELPGFRINVLGEDPSGGFWFASGSKGPLRRDPRTGQIARLPSTVGPDVADDSLRFERAYAIEMVAGRGGALWFGTDRGLYRLERGRATRYSFDPKSRGPGNIIFHLLDGGDGTLWLTTNKGLVHFDTATGQHRRYEHNRSDPAALGGFTLTRMLRDRQGNLWVGTGEGGLHRLDRTAGRATVVRFDPSDPRALPGTFVGSMAEAPDGTVWIANDSGLVRLDLATMTATRPQREIRDIGTVTVDRAGNLWTYSSRRNRLLRLDARTGRELEAFPRSDREPNISTTGGVNSIYDDPSGTLWIATSDVGLVRFDPRTGVSHRYPSQRVARPGLSDSLDHEVAIRAVMDRAGTIWLGTGSGGLNRLDVRTGKFRSYFDRAMGIAQVGHVIEDRKGRIWFGTNGNGLFMLDPRTGRNTRYTTEQGLAHNMVARIVEDETGILWLSTAGGVSRFDPEARTFRTFGPRDGVPGIGLPYTALRTRSGRILVGGNEGLLMFDPQVLSGTPVRPLLVLETVTFRTPSGRDSSTSLYDARRVHLPYGAADVTFTFNGLDYRRPDAVRYQYRLSDGTGAPTAHWTDGGAERSARYPSLAPGRYRFEVRTTGADGLWTSPISVRFTVAPPWWRTWWAYLFYAVLFGLGVFAVDRIQRRRLLAKEREAARERELEQAREIEKAYAQLQATQQQLVQQEKLASLGALTAGIAHEIKNPLNFVNNFAGLTRELVADLKDELTADPNRPACEVVKAAGDLLDDLAENARRIQEHGKRADSIIKSMLAHARGSSGSREVVDVNRMVSEYADLAYHAARAQRPGLELKLEKALDPAAGSVEGLPQDLSRVFVNLVQNAFQAVDARNRAGANGDGAPGDFSPLVRVSTRADGDHAEIRVWDNGGGIPDAVRAKIFEPFFTTKPTGEGTGLGLSLSHEIVAAHGGTLALETDPDVGTTEFTVRLPRTAPTAATATL